MFTALRQRWRAYRDAIEARVANGVELLDGQNPGWMWRVDRRRIDVRYTLSCPLGQVYGHFGDGLVALWPDLSYHEAFVTHAVACGFASTAAIDRRWWPVRAAEAALLRRAWVAAIEAAQARRTWVAEVDARRHRSAEPASPELVTVDHHTFDC